MVMGNVRIFSEQETDAAANMKKQSPAAACLIRRFSRADVLRRDMIIEWLLKSIDKILPVGVGGSFFRCTLRKQFIKYR